jgi:hypothetical protein
MINGRSKKRIHEGVSQLKSTPTFAFFTNDISERTAEIKAEKKVRQRLQKCADAGLPVQVSAAYSNLDGPVYSSSVNN